MLSVAAALGGRPRLLGVSWVVEATGSLFLVTLGFGVDCVFEVELLAALRRVSE